MFKNYKFTAADRFLRYVQIDTQSDPQSSTFPSTEKQKNLSHLLAEELKEIGVVDAQMDEFGYVYATIPSNIIPSNTNKTLPVICFCAHVDTAPDCSGLNVKPIVHNNYQGKDIVLPDDATQVIRIVEYPYLNTQIGNDIITASGKTLLGSDDKAGVAEIMDMANFLISHPEVKHGAIKILFTPDEEIGRGPSKVDLKKLGADFAYTLDGDDAGTIEDENFCADKVELIINGVISHPGRAKGKMINALKIMAEILDTLPKDSFSPETTEGRQGFIHPIRTEGIAERCLTEFFIRDFLIDGLKEKEDLLKGIVEKIVGQYKECSFEFKVSEQYRNMKVVLDKNPQVVELAKQAVERAGLKVKIKSIRGGTDGCLLSFMGLPCANLFAGQQAIHSKHEFISVQDMNKAVEVLVYLVGIT